MKSKPLHMAACLLLWIGGLNLGLYGLSGFNLLSSIFGDKSLLASMVYLLIGLATVFIIITHKGNCTVCAKN